MPVFSHFWRTESGEVDIPRLQRSGPVLMVQISVHPTHEKKIIEDEGEPPTPIDGLGLVDTGASSTCVDESILNQLNIPTIASSDVWTPHGSGPQNIYPCQISFPGTPLPDIPFNRVLGSNLEGFGAIALIGRDVLSQCLLVFNGVEGNWTISF